MRNATEDLKRLAVEAHAAGVTTEAFFKRHWDAMKAIHPYDIKKYRRLYNKLLRLVLSGEAKPLTKSQEARRPLKGQRELFSAHLNR